jgi:Fe-S cluster assembly protein SufD
MSTLLFNDENARAAAKTRFETLPLPTRLDQDYRFANLKAFDLTPYAAETAPFTGDRERLIKASVGIAEPAGKMIFANDRLIGAIGDMLAKQGVIWKPLEFAAKENADLLEGHFMVQGEPLGCEKFAALHAARVKTGTFLYVPRGVEVALPVEAFHWLSGEANAVFPHTLIIAEEGSKVTLVDYFQGAEPDTAGASVGFSDIYAGPGSQVNYVCVQNWNRHTVGIQVANTVVARGAAVKSLNVNLGGRYARTEAMSRLTGEGGRSDMLAVTVGGGEQEFDQRTYQDHQAPGASSDLLYKNALDGASHAIFAGMIKVESGAHHTDAYQKVRNLILSDDAEADSMPGLEILADDVKCSHGAASGQIEADELFYLLARGIPHKAALQLLVNGFLQEVIDRLGNPALGAKLGELVTAKLGE